MIDDRYQIDLYDLVAKGEDISLHSPAYAQLSDNAAHYSQFELLGEGGLKTVYKCYDERAQRWVAYAELKEGLPATYYDYFIHEAWLTASLSHPNIIKVHDVGIDDKGQPFFTMELKANTTLKEHREATTDQRVLLQHFCIICDAIEHAHSKGVLHLDLKPENIQCHRYTEILVCDWGLGKSIALDEEGSATDMAYVATLLGSIKGSPGYMAPEQFSSAGEKERETDIYCLGCLLYFVLYGESPFDGETQEETFENNKEAFINERTEKRIDALPKSLRSVLEKALAYRKEDRYAEVSEMKADIESCLGGYMTAAEKPNRVKQCWLFLLRHKRNAIVVATSLTFLVVIASLYQRVIHDKEEQVAVSRAKSELLEEKVTMLDEESAIYSGALSVNGMKLAHEFNLVALEYLRIAKGITHDEKVRSVVEPIEKASKIMLRNYSAHPRYLNNILFLESEFIRMNFNIITTMDKEELKPSEYQVSMCEIAQLYPHNAYTDQTRPDIKQLEEVVQQALQMSETLSPEMRWEMTRILLTMVLYDMELRRGKSVAYNELMTQLFNQLNAGENVVRYDSGGLVLDLHYERECKYTVRAKEHSLLQYFVLNELKVTDEGDFFWPILNGFSARRLDLRGMSAHNLPTERILVEYVEEVILEEGSPLLRVLPGLIQRKDNGSVEYRSY